MKREILAQRIRIRREETGMTLQQVADAVGITKSTVQRYEQGAIERPRVPVVQSIAAALEVPAVWLMGESDERMDEELRFAELVRAVRVRPGLYGLLEAAQPLEERELAQLTRIARALPEQDGE